MLLHVWWLVVLVMLSTVDSILKVAIKHFLLSISILCVLLFGDYVRVLKNEINCNLCEDVCLLVLALYVFAIYCR